MMSRAAWVDRSVGELNSVAVARQWMQCRLHPLVSSQKINRGLLVLAAVGLAGIELECCPLPCAEVMYPFLPTRTLSGSTLGATIGENDPPSGDCHHRKL